MTFSSYDQRPCKTEASRAILWRHGAKNQPWIINKRCLVLQIGTRLETPPHNFMKNLLWQEDCGCTCDTQVCSLSRSAPREHQSLSLSHIPFIHGHRYIQDLQKEPHAISLGGACMQTQHLIWDPGAE